MKKILTIAILAIIMLMPFMAFADDGDFYFPLAGRDTSWIYQGYSQDHPGLHINVTSEDLVVAVEYGTVTIQNDVLMLSHNDGCLWTIYYGLTEIYVQNGEIVPKGTQLGKVTNNNLFYLEMNEYLPEYDSFQYVDPMNYIEKPNVPNGTLEMTSKAVWLSQNVDWYYGQGNSEFPNPRNLVGGYDGSRYISTVDDIRSTDCSAFVTSMYIQYLNIPIDSGSSTMMSQAKRGEVLNGYTPYVYNFNGDYTQLIPGDILWKSGHVGLYVGNGYQVEQTGGNNYYGGPFCNTDLSDYTHIIRWVK